MQMKMNFGHPILQYSRAWDILYTTVSCSPGGKNYCIENNAIKDGHIAAILNTKIKINLQNMYANLLEISNCVVKNTVFSDFGHLFNHTKFKIHSDFIGNLRGT
jgi:hypothetical protein